MTSQSNEDKIYASLIIDSSHIRKTLMYKGYCCKTIQTRLS
jgi:hypothetical protein